MGIVAAIRAVVSVEPLKLQMLHLPTINLVEFWSILHGKIAACTAAFAVTLQTVL